MYTMKDAKTIDAICELYKEGATIKEVSEAAQVSPNTVGQIIKEHGLTRPRGKQSRVKRATFTRTCPACGNIKHLPGAMFCMDCGSLLASRRELAAEAADRVAKFLQKYATVIDASCAMRDIGIAVDYLRGGASENEQKSVASLREQEV